MVQIWGMWSNGYKCRVIELCDESEVFGYFQLSDMRYDDRHAVTKRVSTTALQFYLI